MLNWKHYERFISFIEEYIVYSEFRNRGLRMIIESVISSIYEYIYKVVKRLISDTTLFHFDFIQYFHYFLYRHYFISFPLSTTPVTNGHYFLLPPLRPASRSLHLFSCSLSLFWYCHLIISETLRYGCWASTTAQVSTGRQKSHAAPEYNTSHTHAASHWIAFSFIIDS